MSSCTSTREEVHLFGSYGQPSVPATWPSFSQVIETTWGAGTGPIRLWSISGRGHSRQRFDAAAESAPLPRAEVSARVGSWSVRPLAKLAISVGNMAIGKQPIVIDADQTIELYGGTVFVGALVPQTMQNVGKPTGLLVAPAGALVVDELVGARVVEIDRSIGARDAVLTTYLYASDQASAVATIPRGAVEVEVSPAQADAGAWRWSAGDPNTLASSTTLGTFTPDGAERVPSATHLVVEAGGERFFTLTWKIRA